jgi:hypothetical protein
MSYALFGLLYSTMSSLLLIMGTGCAVNKAGNFFKLLEEETDDNFKKAFDKVAGDLVNDFNNSFVSLNLISSNVSKLAIISYELMIGEKFIKKTKDGKIIVDDKNAIFDNYENKIGALNEKIKKFKIILKESNKDNMLDFELSDEEDNENDEEANNEDNNEDENSNNSEEEIEEINAD